MAGPVIMAGPVSKETPLLGQTLGHYRILEKIGEGGMGEVYRARDDHLRRDVAVKVLPAGTLANEHARKRFRKEAEALSKLEHPNIATIHDFDTQAGVDFHHSTWGGSMLKVRLIGRGMCMEFAHPQYQTPILTCPIQEIRECLQPTKLGCPFRETGTQADGLMKSWNRAGTVSR